jgi:hypothetical protein
MIFLLKTTPQQVAANPGGWFEINNKIDDS